MAMIDISTRKSIWFQTPYKQIILEDNVVLTVVALGVPPSTWLACLAESLTILSVLRLILLIVFFMIVCILSCLEFVLVVAPANRIPTVIHFFRRCPTHNSFRIFF